MISVAHYGFSLLTVVKETEMQKFELKRTSGRLVACAVLALSSTAFAGSALAAADNTGTANVQASAATASADSGKRMHHRDHHKRGHRHHRRMGDAAMLIPGYGPVPKDVVESLSLNAEQTALLDDAKSLKKKTVKHTEISSARPKRIHRPRKR